MRRELSRRLAAAEARAETIRAEEARIDFSGLTDWELTQLQVAVYVHIGGLTEDEAWVLELEHVYYRHEAPGGVEDPRFLGAARRALAERAAWHRENPRLHGGASAEPAERIVRDTGFLRRVLERARRPPGGEAGLAQALRELAGAERGEPRAR